MAGCKVGGFDNFDRVASSRRDLIRAVRIERDFSSGNGSGGRPKILEYLSGQGECGNLARMRMLLTGHLFTVSK